MSKLNDLPFATLQFYTTAPYDCSYLEGRTARSQVATPSHAIDTATYSSLINRGFRRSGSFTYRPLCTKCKECIPVRINAKSFKKSKSQKRVWNKLFYSLNFRIRAPEFSTEHYHLYSKYQASRHSGGGMDTDSREQYKHFLLQSNVDTSLIEFREATGRLRMISIIDNLSDGISSVYTFFDPSNKKLSFGIFNILWQVEYCKSLGLEFLYLGYYIKKSKKMAYKTKFQPLQGLFNGIWTAMPKQEQIK